MHTPMKSGARQGSARVRGLPLRMFLCTSSALALAATGTTSARAETAGDQPARAQLEEIVVTARKREESLMNIPAAITAVSGAALERRGVTSMEGVANTTPELVVYTGNSAGGAGISLRGVGSPYTSVGIEQAVSINVDGVYYGRGRVIHSAIFDVERVEILKGPQALFFGKNATAGVIAVTTRKPTAEFEAHAKVGYEFENEAVSGEAIVSGPISDKVRARLAVRGEKRYGGYVKNFATGGTYTTTDAATGRVTVQPVGAPKHDYWPGGDTVSGRLTLQYLPTDQLTFTLTGQADQTKRLSNNGGTALVNCATGFSQTARNFAGRAVPCDQKWRVAQNPVFPALAASNPHYGKHGGELYDDYRLFSVAGTAEYRGSNFTFTTVANYQDILSNSVNDFIYSGAPMIWFWEHEAYKAHSLESRVVTSFASPVNFMVGGYYQHSNYSSANAPAYFGFENSAAVNPADRFIAADVVSGTKGETLSAFGQLIWKVVDQVEVTAGARYTHETKDSDYVIPYANPVLAPGFRVNRPAKIPQTFNNVSPEATITYRPQSNVTVYAAYKTGFKSGGFSNNTLDRPSNSLTFDNAVFGPEKAKGFEGGVRAELFDHTLRASLTGYSYRFKGLQVDFFNPVTFGFITRNAASSTSRGVELEAQYVPPFVAGLTLNGALNYNKSIFKSFPNAPCWAGQAIEEGCNLAGPRQDISGKPTPLAPRWAGTFGFDYTTPLSETIEVGLSANGRYSGSYYASYFANPNTIQPSYTTLDATLRIGSRDKKWDLSLIGKNLTNKRIIYLGIDTAGTGAGTGTALSNPARVHGDQAAAVSQPRMFQVVASYRF
jgi:iron complex outermembrane recepter protein